MMKIATWNVNGIRAREVQLLQWIERDCPDVICLQEIKANIDQVPRSLCDLAGYWCYWHGERAYSGVGLHLRRELFPEKPQFTHPAFDYENRIVTAQVGNLIIASVYVPNGGKDFAAKMGFLEALAQYVEQCHAAGNELIVCGDINIALHEQDVHPKQRDPRVIGQRPEERHLFGLILEKGLIDVQRTLDPNNDAVFTWWPPWRNLRQRNVGWRIDYVLASKSLAGRIAQCTVLAEVGTSDHAPVIACFEPTDVPAVPFS